MSYDGTRQLADPVCCRPWVSPTLNVCKVQGSRREIMSKFDKASDGHSCAGRTLYEMLEDELDEVMARLMAGEYDDNDDAMVDKGKAQGLAVGIAIILNPYYPNVDAVRHAAVERWEASSVV